MPFTLEDLVYGVVLPAAAATMITWLWQRWVADENGRRLGTILPFIAGFHVGYWLLALGPVRPESHWHWLPWVLLLAVLAGVPRLKRPSAIVISFILTGLIASSSGWLLVPTWGHLEPSWGVYLAAFVAIVAPVATSLEPLTDRVPTRWLLVNLTGILTCAAVILALSGSLRFAQIAGCGMAALIGMTACALLLKDKANADGIALPFTLLVTGVMLIGRVNSFSDVPLVSYLLPPLAPLSLWLAVKGPLAKASGKRRWLTLSLPLVISAIAVGIAAATELTGGDEW